MGQIRQALRSFIDEMGWSPEHVDSQGLVIRIHGETGQWLWRAIWPADDGLFISYSIAPFHTPEPRRAAVSDYLSRANFGLLVGNFEIDLRDGETRYKCSVPLREDDLSATMVRDLAFVNFTTFDRYLPGLMAVAFANHDPASAIELTEGDSENPFEDILAGADLPDDISDEDLLREAERAMQEFALDMGLDDDDDEDDDDPLQEQEKAFATLRQGWLSDRGLFNDLQNPSDN